MFSANVQYCEIVYSIFLFLRKYVPEVSKLPSNYLYEPWEASLSVQKAAKCVLGEDYPHRIIQHEKVYKVNIGRLSAAYKANKILQQEREYCLKCLKYTNRVEFD